MRQPTPSGAVVASLMSLETSRRTLAIAYPATGGDLSCYFTTAVAAAGLASASGFRAAVPVHPDKPIVPASWPRGNRSTSPTRAVGVSREQMRNRAAKIKGFSQRGDGIFTDIHNHPAAPSSQMRGPPECPRLGRDHAAAGSDELHQRAGPAVGGEPSRDRRLLRMACPIFETRWL